MWFGDLVTMRWFNDVWMKEVFANFMAAKIVNPSFPDVNHELRFLYQHYPSAYDVDRTEGANPIRQELANLNEAGSLYGAIIYQKAPIVMRQLELLMGADGVSRRPARVSEDRMRSATRPGPISSASSTRERRRISSRGAARGWTSRDGRRSRPTWTFRTARSCSCDFVSETHVAAGLVWPQRLSVVAGGPRETKIFDVMLDGPDTAIPDASGLAAPAWVLPGRRWPGLRLLRARPVHDRSPGRRRCTKSPIL